jgi:hypothetical protein
MNMFYDKTARRPSGYLSALCLLLALAGCRNRDLDIGNGLALAVPISDYPTVMIAFHGEDGAQLPQEMTVIWYDNLDRATVGEYDSRQAVTDVLPPALYKPLCIGVSETGVMDFRGMNLRDSFEVCLPACRPLWYTDATDVIPRLAKEKIVSESTARFYTDGADRTLDIRTGGKRDTVTVDFYPRNALREFTILIHGVKGVGYVEQGRDNNKRGAISGQAASFLPGVNARSAAPSTIIFSRIETYPDGQRYEWSAEQKNLFTRLAPGWNNPETGWTGDWITGTFSSFGPVEPENGQFRLVIGMLNKGGYLYKGVWGYGGRDATEVSHQLTGAWGDNGQSSWSNGRLTETQKAWREGNGGFDVILAGDGGLVIPGDGMNDPNSNIIDMNGNGEIYIP